MGEKHKACRTYNNFKHFLLFISAVTGCVSISAFASLVGIPIEITSSAVELTTSPITAGIEKDNSIIKRKKMKKHDKIVLLEKLT